ncbi:signal peptidase I [Streptomyces filamentosus]|uniref:Signal peptidase I n=2 Tax=Streptomyces TaxID=1883 RepID=A0ABY4UQZ7_STRFL|nr:signal peptidase I [Streptomyces filamentosus]EWS94857.1 signal peptidase I [Streptomyces filamentosus NRRL 11379]USC46699.1 signal peptidase I [Streptomyces filamentosus]
MDTQAQHSERDRSPEPDAGSGEGSRFSRTQARLASVLPWRRVLAGAVLATVALLLFSSYVVQPFLVPSGSMEPTLRVGDRVLVNKLAYRFGAEPQRGDVVVFDGTGSFVREDLDANPLAGLVRGAAASLGLAEPADTDFVKRVVGVGGDRIVCCDAKGRLAVNGTVVDEPYLYPGDTASRAPFDIVVSAGTLWMMGDHRSRSSDSRDRLGSPGGGMVPVERVTGRVDWLGWPPARVGPLAGTGAFGDVRAPGAAHG